MPFYTKWLGPHYGACMVGLDEKSIFFLLLHSEKVCFKSATHALSNKVTFSPHFSFPITRHPISPRLPRKKGKYTNYKTTPTCGSGVTTIAPKTSGRPLLKDGKYSTSDTKVIQRQSLSSPRKALTTFCPFLNRRSQKPIS